MSSIHGHVFRISTFGESHGGGIGVVIDDCPLRLTISEAEIQFELDRPPSQCSVTNYLSDE